ncbi:effector-associated constant component EACC1 [Streptomyces vinaceus]|uniref:effector-associated constant component EACC1 n=1 Tax=Streptomyces vinaceus TaxID=1960 RepID=UPI0019AA8B26|nr:hypothetical protein [Streptomyces vinaceus]GHE67555.1 hypothetical protein GCM10017778_60720 [Streptomyces vinaceus]
MVVSTTDLGEGEKSTASLLKWLSYDSAVRRHCRPAPVYARPEAGSMGSGLDAISVVIQDVSALGSLAAAIAAWMEMRRRSATVRITRGDTAVAIERASPRQVAEIAGALGIPDATDGTDGTASPDAVDTVDTRPAGGPGPGPGGE